MNTTQTLTAQSLTGVCWSEPAGVAHFENGRLFGVTDGAGRWLTFNGQKPGAWDRKRTAAEIAATIDAAGAQWVAEVQR